MCEATRSLRLSQHSQVQIDLFKAVSNTKESAENQSNGGSTQITFSASDSGKTQVLVDFTSKLQATNTQDFSHTFR